MAMYFGQSSDFGKTIIAFKRLEGDKPISYVVGASRKSAELIMNKEQQLLVQNGSIRTGALYRSLQIKQVKVRQKKYSRSIISNPLFTVGPKYVGKGGNKGSTKGVNYGHLVELGHKTKSGNHIPAKPFMRPAADSSKQEIQGFIINAMNEALADFGR